MFWQAGDIISVISKPPMGIWTGMLNNKVGNFKFIYVDVLVETEKEEEAPKIRQLKLSRRPRPNTLLELLEQLNLQVRKGPEAGPPETQEVIQQCPMSPLLRQRDIGVIHWLNMFQ